MIIKTENKQEFVELHDLLSIAGYTSVSNAILPNWIAGSNFTEIAPEMGVYALASEKLAEMRGYCLYGESEFIKQLKKCCTK